MSMTVPADVARSQLAALPVGLRPRVVLVLSGRVSVVVAGEAPGVIATASPGRWTPPEGMESADGGTWPFQ
jgi:hypothetical protein